MSLVTKLQSRFARTSKTRPPITQRLGAQLLGFPWFRETVNRYLQVAPHLSRPDDDQAFLNEELSSREAPAPARLLARLLEFCKFSFGVTVQRAMRRLERMLIAGQSFAGAVPVLTKTWSEGEAFVLDRVGETAYGPSAADEYRDDVLELIPRLEDMTSHLPPNPVLDRDHLGRVPRAAVAIKLSALSPLFGSLDKSEARRDIERRLAPILEQAERYKVAIEVDQEWTDQVDLVQGIVLELARKYEVHMTVAVQAYLRDSRVRLENLIEGCKRTGTVIGVRLVRGAYLEEEARRAGVRQLPSPVFETKALVDQNYKELTELLLDATPAAAPVGLVLQQDSLRHTARHLGGVLPKIATHNAESILFAAREAERRGLPPAAIEFCALFGMSDSIHRALRESRARVRAYVPYGKDVAEYLFRRIAESASSRRWVQRGLGAQSTALDLDVGETDVVPGTVARPNLHDAEELDHYLACVDQELTASAPEQLTLDESLVRLGDLQAEWSSLTAEERHRVVLQWGEDIEQNLPEFAAKISIDAGLPVGEAAEEAARSAGYVLLSGLRRPTPGRPLGTVAALWPGLPLSHMLGAAAASLCAGNALLIACDSVQEGALDLAVSMALERGIPVGISDVSARRLLRVVQESPDEFDSVAFGDRVVPVKLARASVLVQNPYYGSNTAIVDRTSMSDETINTLVRRTLAHGGMHPGALSRILFVDDNEAGEGKEYQLFIQRFLDHLAAVRPGPSNYAGTTLGPVRSVRILERLKGLVEAVPRLGGKVLYPEAAGHPLDTDYLGRPIVAPVLFELSEIGANPVLGGGGPFVGVASIGPMDLDRVIESASISAPVTVWSLHQSRINDLESKHGKLVTRGRTLHRECSQGHEWQSTRLTHPKYWVQL